MSRAYGSNAHLLAQWASSYGARATGNYYRMPFTKNGVGSEQGLIPSPVLGFGRDPADPFLDAINVDGDIGVPIDPRYMGFWLRGLLGNPVTTQVKATGSITFGANPSVGHTITINGVAFSFVSGSSSGMNIGIKATATLTAVEVATVLNASANTSVDDATYTAVSGQPVVSIEHDTAGLAGNAFTLAASNATVSGAKLTGGCYQHVFESGKTSLPSLSLEGGLPEIPAYFVHDGVVIDSLGMDFQRTGPAIATINAIAQGETRYASSQGGTPVDLDLDFISNAKGALRSGGQFIGNLTSANVQYSNNMERIETIRDDGKIDGADPTVASLTGNFDIRFADTTFIDKAAAGEPIDVEFSYILRPGMSIVWTAPRVWIPKPKQVVDGPGGVTASYAYNGARDPDEELMLTVTLQNDVAGTVYVPA